MAITSQQKGKVVKSTRKIYLVNLAGKTVSCTVRGKLTGAPKGGSMSVKVGDDVWVQMVTENEGVIEKILPRHSKLSRAVEGKAYREHIIAVNIDQILIIMSTHEPEFKSGLLDRYLIIAEKNQLNAVICINKIDLAEQDEFEQFAKWYPDLGYPLFFTSAITGQGLEKFKAALKNKVSVLVGHSGVGKSSLIKKVEPHLDLKVEGISGKTGKGMHTTTFVQLFPLSIGGYVIDTPGVRELGLWNIYRDELKNYFVEFNSCDSECRFNDCKHLKEPGCAVKNAVDNGKIFEERYLNYKNIYNGLRAASHELIKYR